MELYENNQKGITLIALVITIIVLLILAGIAIRALSGENGILIRASEAKQKTGKEEIIEKAKLEILEYQSDNEGNITEEEASKIIAKYDIDYQENADFTFKTNEQGEKIIKAQNGIEIPIRDIYPFARTIKFYIDGNMYEVREGTTWEQFRNSNMSGLHLDWIAEEVLHYGNIHLYTFVSSANYIVCIYNENNVIPKFTSTIIEGATYTSYENEDLYDIPDFLTCE